MADGGSARVRAEELWARAAAEREREAEARLKAEQLEVEAGAWAAGADGERRVANALQALPDGWVVLHDRLLRPGTSLTNLDHVVVGPGGVFLVDAKNWAGGLSVHDGNLWQHAGRSSAKGAELDKLAAFAGEMETALGVPVVPVVALAGGHAARFRAQRVRGVEVVPGNRLVKWLRRQPATTGAVSAELLSRKVAHTYPSASADDSTATPSMTTLTVPAVLNARPSETPTPARRRRATARQGRRRPSTLKAVVGFGLLVVLSQLAPRAAQVFPSSLPSVLVPDRSSPTPASSPPGLVTSRKALPVTVPAGEVTAWLPDNTSLAGWKASTKARQPFSVTLRFTYPEGASRKRAQAIEAAAEKTVMRLAEQAAIALPAPKTTSQVPGR